MTWWAKSSREHQPNALSILRGILGIILPYFLLTSSVRNHVIALFIFIFAMITDYFDGYLARRYNVVSNFGKLIDPITDKILVLIAFVCFAQLGFYSLWCTVPIIARELLVTFCRIGFLQEGKAIAAEKLGKLKLVVQAVAMFSAFAFLLAQDGVLFPSFVEFFRSLLFGALLAAVFLTILSGIDFTLRNKELFSTPSFARFVSACGVGLIPFTPGTLGSLLGLAIIGLVFWNGYLYAAVFILILIAGYWAVSRLDLSQNKDPQFVVVDEVLGMMVTLAGVPLNFTTILLGFLFFRLFDIVKPFPLRRLERIKGFWGITCDDLGAGVYAWILLSFFW